MENVSSTKQLLERYYQGFANKQGWEEVLSEGFLFWGGDMAQTEPIKGRKAYEQVIERFSKRFEGMRVTEMIVEGERAYVTANYDFIFSNGVSMNGNVAEIWTASKGRLTSLRIFFDTLTFAKNT